MASKISQLRALDAEIVRHVIDRGKLLEKRQKLVAGLRGTPELEDYALEMKEWLESVQVTP